MNYSFDAIIHPSSIRGVIQAPASKSSMQRACAAAICRGGRTIIHNAGDSSDELAALEIIKKLGAEITYNNDDLIIDSSGVNPTSQEINCGESGLSARMFTPIIALHDKLVRVTGTGSLLNRPFNSFLEALPKMGVDIKSNRGKLPIEIKGPLVPLDVEIDGSVSSQFLTGLILAYSAANASGVSIRVKNLQSKPYIRLTLNVMKEFGMKLPVNHADEEFHFTAGTAVSTSGSRSYTVESDWSAGAFLLVAGAIAGSLTIRGLDIISTQADRAILDLMMEANAAIAIEAKGIKVLHSPVDKFHFDASESPDLFPPLVALAAYCKGVSTIKGVNRLIHKESNRAIALQEEFGKMGLVIGLDDDTMYIHGEGRLQGGITESRGDHRIAMAIAVAALKAESATVIRNAESVKKSYPRFFEDLKKLGANVSLEPGSSQ